MCYIEDMTDEELASAIDESLKKTGSSLQMFDDYAKLSISSGLGIPKSAAFHYNYIVKFDTFDDHINVSFYSENGLLPDRKHNIIFKLIGGVMHITENFVKKRDSKVVSLIAVNDRIDKHLYALSKSKRTLSSNGWSFIKTTIIDDKMVYWFEKI